MIKIGFTGTRAGMTAPQEIVVANLLKEYHAEGAEFHHGDCIGADNAAHTAAMDIGYLTVAWPANSTEHRGWAWADIIKPEMLPLERNKEIVKVADMLIAASRSYEEAQRSGTWFTIRRAREANILRIIVFPDGSTKTEQPDFAFK